MEIMKLKNQIYCLVAILICLSNYSCKKDNVSTDPLIEDPKTLTLDNILLNKNKATITWSSIKSQNFISYRIRKYVHHLQKTRYEEIAIIRTPNDTCYIDSSVPDLPYVAYEIIVELSNSVIIRSNRQEISRSSKFFYNIRPSNVVYYKNINRVFITDYYKKIVIVADYKTSEYIDTISNAVEIGNLCVGDNGKGPELYIPKSNGQLSIYNALTLEKKIDLRFNLYDGYQGNLYSVTTNNQGKIYLSTATDYPLSIIDRESLAIVGQARISWRDAGRLVYMPKNNSILEITKTSSLRKANLYILGNTGLVINKFDDNYDGYYSLDDEALTVSQKEDYFISSDYGTVFTTALKYVGVLPKGGGSYETNEDGTLIYACYFGYEKNINCYDYPKLQFVKKIPTIGYPYNVYLEGDTLYCVSSIDNNTAVYSDIMLEKQAIK